LKRQIEAGEAFGPRHSPAAVIDDLAKQGKVDAASRPAIARSGVGIGIKKGAPRPDIRTPGAFKRTLLRREIHHMGEKKARAASTSRACSSASASPSK